MSSADENGNTQPRAPKNEGSSGPPDPIKANLELDKLRLEISDIRWGWVRTLATALLTLTIAILGWYGQQRLQYNADVNTKLGQNEQRYFSARTNLSNKNVLDRVHAASDLVALAQDTTPLHPSEATPENVAELLNERMAAEQNASVLVALSTNLGRLGWPALKSTIAGDVELAQSLARESGAYLAYVTWQRSHKRLSQCSSSNDLTDIDSALRDIADPLQQHPELMVMQFNASDMVTSGRFYETCDNAATNYVVNKNAPPDLEQLKDTARSLAATGFAIEDLLRALSGKLDGVTLNKTIEFAIDIHDIDMSGAKIRDAYVSGHAEGLKCRRCDLSESMVGNLSTGGADFTGAILKGTLLDDLSRQHPPAVFTQSDLSEALVATYTSDGRFKAYVHPATQKAH